MKAIEKTAKENRHAACQEYFIEFLPRLEGQLLIEDLRTLSCRFTYRLAQSDLTPWQVEIASGRLVYVGHEEGASDCCFVCDEETLLEVAGARLSPQDAFFDLRIEIEGDMELGLKLSTVLAPFFERYPFRP